MFPCFSCEINWCRLAGVNFTNVWRAAFTRADPKKTVSFFALLGSSCVKAARTTLIKLTPYFVVAIVYFAELQIFSLQESILLNFFLCSGRFDTRNQFHKPNGRKSIWKIGKFYLSLTYNYCTFPVFWHIIQCPPLNRITFGQHKSDNNNRMIQLTDVICVLLKFNRAINIWLL